MTEFIQPGDLDSYPGLDLSAITEETVKLVAELANGLVFDVVGTLETIPTRVRALTLEVAARALRNPEGFTSVTEKIDDYTTTTRRENEDAVRAGVYLTDDEIADLLGVKKGVTRVKSIPMRVPGYDRRYA